ncbi:isocitrate/isopropylmalate dehydrogenase family protein [Methylobacterium oryzisoli]|uniref:isocitrate/isopropylmalate dehydrogenase family protein n=1 Tax=Methylobacterium oryzisoli TaxID=3385502 RepID=UPI003891E552
MKDSYAIALLPGDGIGPEVTQAAAAILADAAARHGLALAFTPCEAGAGTYRRTGEAISAETVRTVGEADAILLGAMGLPAVRYPDGTEIAPQIDLREHFGLFASLRPCRLFPGVPSRVRTERVDMLIVRELTEGLFAGRHDPAEPSDERASDRLTITRATSEKLFDLTFAQARLRRRQGRPGHVTLLDKANVLRSNAFLRRLFDEAAARHPDIATDRLYIDAGAMMLVTDPERFDVVVTENIFGDIASEIAAGVVGGLGVAPSGDVSESRGLFQPSHGTAPDIAGRGIANPVAAILSAAMLLDWLGQQHGDARCDAAAAAIRAATGAVLAAGPRTRDIGGTAGTEEVTGAIRAALAAPALAA